MVDERFGESFLEDFFFFKSLEVFVELICNVGVKFKSVLLLTKVHLRREKEKCTMVRNS